MSKINEKIKDLDFLFKPKTVAIYGASEKSKHFFGGMEIQGFDKNKIYLINPSREELFGLKVYKSLKDIPEDTIDHLIITIRRETNSWKWALFTVVYTTLLAWLVAFAVYQVGSLF